MTNVNSKKSKKTILVIEDEQAIRAMLHLALDSAGFNVKEAEEAKQALHLIAEQLPDLILLDWMLPAMSGIDVAKRLKQDKLTRNIPIIMLTAKAEEDNKVIGLEVGVDDYVIKPFSPRELIARIRAVLRRGPLQQPDGTIQIQELLVDTIGQRVSIQGQAIKLGPLEYRLLSFFVTHQNRVYSRDELLTHVWGGDAYLDERTVDVLVRRLRRQLKASNCDRLIQTIHGSGYRFSEIIHE